MIQNYRERLIKLTEYNLWANKRIAKLIAGMEEGSVNKKVISSFTSIKASVLHIWDAETIWRLRMKGHSINDWPGKNFSGSITDLIDGFIDSSVQLKDHVINLNPDEVNLVINYSNMKREKFAYSVSDIITHCVNHSTYHRGQIITMLRQTGMTELISTDYINYIREI